MISNTDLSESPAVQDHVRGGPVAKVTLVEYGEFECPFCARAEPAVLELLERYPRDLRLIFRHNPRNQDHPHAHQAAEAAEAAADQGKFWEMHDLLFQNQSKLEEADLVGYAERLGLDIARFRADLKSKAHHARVHHDELTGVKSHVISTPAFFINGKHFNDKPDFKTLSAAIEGALSH
jgi:protein-disulfide isomerase